MNTTVLNGVPLAGEDVCVLAHTDIITLADRQFRWEYPEGSILHIPDQCRILTPKAKLPVSYYNVDGGEYS